MDSDNAHHPAPTKFNTCVFCGGKPLTKTHLWPGWLNDILPRQPNFNQNSSLATGTHLTPEERQTAFQKHKKDIFDQQPYLACYLCNGGWMKEFEDEVVKFVKPVILGTFRGRLDQRQQQMLAGWLSLIIIVSELASFTQKTVSKADIEFLKIQKKPPENWTILATKLNGQTWMKRKQYHSAAIYPGLTLDRLPRTGEGIPKYNTQIATLGIGALLVQVFICPARQIVDRYRSDYAHRLKILWPITPYRRLKFPLSHAWNDQEAEFFAHDFFLKLKEIVHD